MTGKTMYAGLEPVLAEQAASVWRFCLLLVRNRAAADELCFQSFLRLAARREKDTGTDAELLYAAAFRLCEDWFNRKMRKPAKEKALLKAFACRKGDALYSLIRQPFSVRRAAGLRLAGFSDLEIRKITRRRVPDGLSRASEEAMARMKAVEPSEDYAIQLRDRVLDRFSERSVGFENRLHEFRIRFSRAAPYLALLVLCFFAFCVWYVQNH